MSKVFQNKYILDHSLFVIWSYCMLSQASFINYVFPLPQLLTYIGYLCMISNLPDINISFGNWMNIQVKTLFFITFEIFSKLMKLFYDNYIPLFKKLYLLDFSNCAFVNNYRTQLFGSLKLFLFQVAYYQIHLNPLKHVLNLKLPCENPETLTNINFNLSPPSIL